MPRTICLLLALGILTAFSVISATWVREKGRALIYTDLSYRTADEFVSSGQRMPSNNFTEYDFNIYADYGLTENYTIGIYFPVLKELRIDATEVSPYVKHRNKGDLDLIQRLQIWSIGGAVFNLELLVGIPTGNSTEPHGLHTGDGEFNYMPGLSMGLGFDFLSLPSFITLYSGINLRTEGFSNEWHSSFQWGLFVYEKSLLLSFEAKKQESLKNNDEITVENGLWNNTSYIAYGGGITYKFNEDTGISVYYKTLTEINNSLAGDIYSIGVFRVF